MMSRPVSSGFAVFSLVASCCWSLSLTAAPPMAAYIFPAGGQAGTTVEVRVGGNNFHGSAQFFVQGAGVSATPRIVGARTRWFEGPIIPQPPSQQSENYPRDHLGKITIEKSAAPGVRFCQAATSQGATATLRFQVGELPEVVEEEIDGEPVPVQVTLPVTINGRTFPREDVDIWTFDAVAGRGVVCEVFAARLGSPLSARLEIRDPQGRRVAENLDGAGGGDPRIVFVPQVSGRHAVHIHDIGFEGLQDYVYRLTITDQPYVTSTYPLGGRRGTTVATLLRGANVPATPVVLTIPAEAPARFQPRWSDGKQSSNSFVLDVDTLPEVLEVPASTASKSGQTFTAPAVLNGQIATAGETDTWSFAAKKGETLVVEVRAASLGSSLDSVLTVVDSNSKILATNDDFGASTDSRLTLSIAADGVYTLRIADRLPSRGGAEFAYRVRVAPPEPVAPGFEIQIPATFVNVERGKSTEVDVRVQRTGGFAGPIDLQVGGLPRGIVVEGTNIKAGANTAKLKFTAEKLAPVLPSYLTLTAQATLPAAGAVPASVLRGPVLIVDKKTGERDGDALLVAAAVPTPFKISATFEQTFSPRGSIYVKPYVLERNGYEGGVEVMLSDIQARHLQGVTGPTLKLPPAKENSPFEYPVALSPWMEIGRTSRACLMAMGKVTDPDGTVHHVSYNSQQQVDQVILIVDPGRLSVTSPVRSLAVARGNEVSIPIEVGRGAGLKGPMRVELRIPEHMRGMTSKPIVVPQDQTVGKIALRFAATEPIGPINMPLTLRAMMKDERGLDVVAESYLTVVPLAEEGNTTTEAKPAAPAK